MLRGGDWGIPAPAFRVREVRVNRASIYAPTKVYRSAEKIQLSHHQGRENTWQERRRCDVPLEVRTRGTFIGQRKVPYSLCWFASDVLGQFGSPRLLEGLPFTSDRTPSQSKRLPDTIRRKMSDRNAPTSAVVDTSSRAAARGI